MEIPIGAACTLFSLISGKFGSWTWNVDTTGGAINSAVGEIVSIDPPKGARVPTDVVTGELETGEIVANVAVSGESLTWLLGDSTSSWAAGGEWVAGGGGGRRGIGSTAGWLVTRGEKMELDGTGNVAAGAVRAIIFADGEQVARGSDSTDVQVAVTTAWSPAESALCSKVASGASSMATTWASDHCRCITPGDIEAEINTLLMNFSNLKSGIDKEANSQVFWTNIL